MATYFDSVNRKDAPFLSLYLRLMRKVNQQKLVLNFRHWEFINEQLNKRYITHAVLVAIGNSAKHTSHNKLAIKGVLEERNILIID